MSQIFSLPNVKENLLMSNLLLFCHTSEDKSRLTFKQISIFGMESKLHLKIGALLVFAVEER